MSTPINLVAIVGQTATGKSDLAMRLAKIMKEAGGFAEIIAADSRTVYKGLDLGTAKPSKDDQKSVPHHLLDIAGPGDHVTAADFKVKADSAIADIQKKGGIPILVGGSGMYIDSVLYNYSFGGGADQAQRNALEELTIEELQARLKVQGLPLPENENNKRYLVRALERAGNQLTKNDIPDTTLIFGLHTTKEILRDRITSRIHGLIERGLLKEVAWAFANYPADSEPLKGTLYSAFQKHLQGETSLEEAISMAVTADMRLAKKQYSWFKRNKSIHWFKGADDAYTYVHKTGILHA